MAAKLRVTLIKSPIGHTARTRGTLRALGLRRVGQTVEVVDNEPMRGMARTVRFLLQTEELAAGSSAGSSAGSARRAGPRSSTANKAKGSTKVAADEPVAPKPARAAASTAAGQVKPRRAAARRTKKESDE